MKRGGQSGATTSRLKPSQAFLLTSYDASTTSYGLAPA
jgi:hypothetical protein